MATIKQENVVNIVIDGKGKDFEKSGLRDLTIFELRTVYFVPTDDKPDAIKGEVFECVVPIRYTDFIDPYWWDTGDMFDGSTEADAILKEKGDVIVSFRRGQGMYSLCPFEKGIRKTRRLKDVLEREVIRHFTSQERLSAAGAIPVWFDTFEVSAVSKDEVRGTLVRYKWAPPHGGASVPGDEVRFWAYGRLVRKEQQKYCIKFVDCPVTA